MMAQTIQEKFVELQNSKQTPQSSRPKIQRVAYYRRNISNFERHYKPKLVSIGPIHHDNADLKLGDKYKLMWASKYIENIHQIPEDLHKKIADNIDKLKGHFDNDVLTSSGRSLEGFGSLEEKLSWILFVDGCSLLHIVEKLKLDELEDMNIKDAQFFLVMMDMLLLENQLPYEVLKLLWKDDDERELIKSMTNFLSRCTCDCDAPDESQSKKEKDVVPKGKGEGEHSVSIRNRSQLETPTHLLDLYRKMKLTTSDSKSKRTYFNMKWIQTLLRNIQKWSEKNSEENGVTRLPLKWNQKVLRKIKDLSHTLFQNIKKWSQKNSEANNRLITYRNIQDLKAVGISLKSSKTRRPTDIDFTEGWFAAELTLPEIVVDDSSAANFLNLIAYEMCPDFDNNYAISSFVAFMDSLIDQPEDVKELRSKGILLNCLGSDKEVADLFNIIGTDVVYNGEKYQKIRRKIHDHYRNKYKTWIAQGFHTYFSSPWTIIAFIAAFIALVLTFIQTWFTINPPSK